MVITVRILLVEDETRLAEALEQILKRQGYLVDVTGDGAAGRDMAETGIYGVIILDRMLPKIKGVDILKHLRSNSIKTPIIFLTAKDSISNRVEGLVAVIAPARKLREMSVVDVVNAG